MKSRTFRLSDDEIGLLERLADEQGVSQSDVVRSAIRLLAADGVHVQDGSGDRSTSAALAEQLAAKDGQIAELMSALKAEQALHVQTQARLPDGDPGKHWWQRLRRK